MSTIQRVDRFLSESPSASNLGGQSPFPLSKSINHVLTELKVLGDLLEGHLTALNSGIHLIVSLPSYYQQSVGLHKM